MEHKTIDAAEFKDLDEDFMPIYGKNPDKDSVLKILWNIWKSNRNTQKE